MSGRNRPTRTRKPGAAGHTGPGAVRIIGGRWRGRRIPVASGADIRPTPDRVRETLFNWLGGDIAGARCLDLFAGTGVLGLEALSRGAAEVLFVERDPIAARSLRAWIATLEANARLICDDAVKVLAAPVSSTFDIVFLDPPFADARYADLCTLLEPRWLNDDALVYVESSIRAIPGSLPERWQLHRDGTAGDVRYALYRRAS